MRRWLSTYWLDCQRSTPGGWVPSVIRVLLSDVEWTNPELQNTSLASCIAVIAGYVVYRRNVSISDTQAIKHTLVSLTSAFGFVLIILAFLVIEHDRRHPVPDVAGLEAVDARRYGDTSITWLRAPGSAAPQGGTGQG